MDNKFVDSIIEKWKSDPDFVIEMMQDIQDEERYISRAVLERIAKKTLVPLSRLYHIATFYKSFTLTPRGKHEIQVCTGTACHVKGAQQLIDAFERELGIKEGHTTDDGMFTLEGVRCLGCCSLAPVITIDKDLYGDVKTSDIPKMIEKYIGGEK
ncbi:MAG: NADH-quinone oxidoreductase subunit NuoE [Candidatus Delongbacteria bacterium]